MKISTFYSSANGLSFRVTLFALFFSAFCLQKSFGQLAAGTYTVGSGYTYSNLGAVATALSSGISGNVVFELQTNYSEGSSPSITFSSWAGNSTYTVTIRPAAGVSTMLIDSGRPSSALPLINLVGTQNLILDGRPGGTGTSILWTIQNTASGSSGPAVEMTAGANNNTLEYLNLKSSNTSNYSGTVYIYCGPGGPDNTGDIIQNCNLGWNGNSNNYPCSGVGAFGYGPVSGSGAQYRNNSISVLNNNIQDFFAPGNNTIGSGVKVSGSGNSPDYGHNWTISGNSFFRSFGAGDGGDVNVIDFEPSDPGQAGSGSAGNVISNNFIGGQASALAGGVILGDFGTSTSDISAPSLIGINIEAQGVTVSGNVIGGMYMYSSGHQTGFTGIFIPFGNAAGSYTISNNTIGSNYGPGKFYWGTSGTTITTGTGSKTFTTQTGLSYQPGDTLRISSTTYQQGGVTLAYGLKGSVTAYNPATGSLTVNVYFNMLGTNSMSGWNITLVKSITTFGQYASEGIRAYAGGGTCAITGNTVGNITVIQGYSVVAGIVAQDGAFTITGNTIYNLASQSASSSPIIDGDGIHGSVVGISQQSTTNAVQTVSNNIIYNLYSIYSQSNSSNITGIELFGPSSNAYANVANANFVYSSSCPNAATGTYLYGLYMYSGNYGLTNNMVRLGMRADTASITGGVFMEGITDGEDGSTSTGTQKFYHNTIYIGGTKVISGVSNTYCFRRNNVNPGQDIIDLRNNILVNNRSDQNGPGKHCGIFLENASNVTTDYNDVFGNGSGANFGRIGNTAYATQSAWITANASFDANSKNTDPLLINALGITPDFHLMAGSPCDAVSGATALYPTDYYGSIRANYSPVDLGAVVFGAGSGTPPHAGFSSSDTSFCVNNCINFTDLSTNSPFGWQWTFTGGSPSSSTVQNPQNICYVNGGNYAVKLVVTNAGGSDTLNLDNFISVSSTPPVPVIHASNDTLYSSYDASYVTYQWLRNDTLIPNANDPFLVTSNVAHYSLQVTNAGGCVSVGSFDIVLGMSNRNIAGSDLLWLSPNPALNELKIESRGFRIEKLGIYNVLGESVAGPMLKVEDQGYEMVIDVSRLPAGIYFVKVENRESNSMTKFIKAANMY